MKYILLCALVLSSNTYAAACGKQGSIEERIKECGSSKGSFVLVTRDEAGLEIYKDSKSGLLWGDRITTDFNHYGSQKACDTDIVESKLLGDVHWRLPTAREFEIAASHGMKVSLPHMEHGFWTSTPVKTRARRRRAPPARVFLWDGIAERTDTGDLKDAASVRCVGHHR